MSELAGRPHTDASAAVDRIDDAPDKPLISVCVPMYNNAPTIERCLRSVLDQDGVEFEIVIVDDQSTDDGATTAASLLRPGDRLIRNEPPRVRCTRGYGCAASDWAVFVA